MAPKLLPVKIIFVDVKLLLTACAGKYLRHMDYPKKIVDIVKNTYDGSEKQQSGPQYQQVTVRQGSVWSPLLFAFN